MLGRSTMVHGRQYAIGVDGTKIIFECAHVGHTYSINMASKRRKLVQRLSADGCKRLASWWSREKGGCIGECPKCEKAAKAAKEQTT